MRVFGLTGNIETGKSTVARVFADHGVPVVHASQAAREGWNDGERGEIAHRRAAARAREGEGGGLRHREYRRARAASRASRPRRRRVARRLDAGRMMDRVLITGFPKLLARRMALRLHAGGAHVSLLV